MVQCFWAWVLVIALVGGFIQTAVGGECSSRQRASCPRDRLGVAPNQQLGHIDVVRVVGGKQSTTAARIAHV
jgi:hypothetical protein